MGLESEPLMFAPQSLADLEHRLRRGEREARRNRVQQASATVKAPDQVAAVAIRPFRSLVQLGAELPVRQNHPADDSQTRGPACFK